MAWWTGKSNGAHPQGFGYWLGTQAAAYLGSELLKHIQQTQMEWQLTDDPPSIKYVEREATTFRIEIAGGTTVHGLVDSLHIQQLSTVDISWPCSVIPLVLLPIPTPAHSAEVLADELKSRLSEGGNCDVSVEPISDTRFVPDGFSVSLIPEQKNRRDSFDTDDENAHFNWVVTGVGSPESTGLKSHWELVYPDKDIPADIVGDIGSRLLGLRQPQNGVELYEHGKILTDKFVLISLPWLRHLAALRSRVIVIAGGRDKVKPLFHILKDGYDGGQLLNTLITDEFTARSLLMCFGQHYGKHLPF